MTAGLPGVVFMACGAIGPLPERWQIPAQLLGMLTAPALSAVYASGLLLWFTGTDGGARLAARLAPA